MALLRGIAERADGGGRGGVCRRDVVYVWGVDVDAQHGGGGVEEVVHQGHEVGGERGLDVVLDRGGPVGLAAEGGGEEVGELVFEDVGEFVH